MASTTTFFHDFFEEALKGNHSLDADQLRISLHTSAYTPNLDTDTQQGLLAGELPTGNGYTAGGIAITGAALSRSGDTVTLDANDISLTASGGPLAFRHGVIYNADAVGDNLVAVILFDDAPQDISLNDGDTFNYTVNVAGLATFQANV